MMYTHDECRRQWRPEAWHPGAGVTDAGEPAHVGAGTSERAVHTLN